MTTCFYTICDLEIQRGLPNSRNLDFVGFRNSFNRFHPDIDLIVYNRSDLMQRGLTYYNGKATFGRELSEKYDIVVNIDADHLIFERLEDILVGDYDVACPSCFNATDNIVGIKVGSGMRGESSNKWLISENEYLHAGLIASTSKQFWKHYEYLTLKYYDRFFCFESDTLNLAAQLSDFKVKVLDGNFDYRKNRQWYGSSHLGKESLFYIENNKIMCEGKKVVTHHFGYGAGKKLYQDVFRAEVSEFIKTNIVC